MFFTRCLMFFLPLESVEKTCRKLCRNYVVVCAFLHVVFLANHDSKDADHASLPRRFVAANANENEGGTCARLRRPPSQ